MTLHLLSSELGFMCKSSFDPKCSFIHSHTLMAASSMQGAGLCLRLDMWKTFLSVLINLKLHRYKYWRYRLRRIRHDLKYSGPKQTEFALHCEPSGPVWPLLCCLYHNMQLAAVGLMSGSLHLQQCWILRNFFLLQQQTLHFSLYLLLYSHLVFLCLNKQNKCGFWWSQVLFWYRNVNWIFLQCLVFCI